MSNFFSNEGPVWQALERIGYMILLNLIWLLCCLPVITMIPATAAFYYAAIKSVRRGCGYAPREFFRSFRNNLKRGIPLTVAVIMLGGLLVLNLKLTFPAKSEREVIFIMIYILFLLLLAGFLVYICPVLSRFSVPMGQLVKMTLGMVGRHLPVTVLLMLGTYGCGGLIFGAFYVDITSGQNPDPATVLFLLLPAGWCYVSTFLVEKVLKKYMPPKPEGDQSWYYE